ncbi:MAG: SRPBCC family protein [Dehalococcoidia bacterium]
MGRVQRQITLNAPVSEVFGYIPNLPRHSEWAANPLKIEQTSGGPVQAGATFSSEGKVFGKTFRDQLTVAEYVPDSRLVLDVVGGGSRFRLSFTTEAEGDGTRLAKASETLRIPFLFKLFWPLIEKLLAPRQFAKDLKRIKARLETDQT